MRLVCVGLMLLLSTIVYQQVGITEEPPSVVVSEPSSPLVSAKEVPEGQAQIAPKPGEGVVEEAASDDPESKEAGPADDVEADSEEQGVEEQKVTKPLYTADLSDEELARRWRDNPALLGALSMGFTYSGRLFNGEKFPEGGQWTLMSPENAWGTQETIEYTKVALEEVGRIYADTPPISIGDLSRKDGGWFRPHKSHQSGRDVDLGFYYVDGPNRHFQAGDARNMDLPRNWALIRALIVKTDVQMILVDRRVQKILYNYALLIGEDKDWLDSVFKAGRASIVKHARRHRGHYHVRFYNPRAQELARRIVPFMDKGKEGTNFAMHRVRNGECLGSIARKYGTSITAIKKANGMASNSLRAGRTLTVPLYGPCIRCPLPPELVLPERNLPPATPEVFLAAMQASERKPEANPSKVRPAIERYIGAGGLFPPFRMYTIPMAY